MNRTILSITRIGDEYIQYGVKPTVRGVLIKGNDSSADSALSITTTGLGMRDLSAPLTNLSYYIDPNYFGTGAWLPAPTIETNVNTVLAEGEELIATVTNAYAHLSESRSVNDMVYQWIPDGQVSEMLTGNQIRIIGKDATVTWSVQGVSPTLGNTEVSTFTVYMVTSTNPVPLLQTLTNFPGGVSPYGVLNWDLFTRYTSVTLEVYSMENVLLFTAIGKTINVSFPDAVGTDYVKVKAIMDGVSSEFRIQPRITVDQPISLKNYRASFIPVNPNTRAPLSDLSQFGDYGTKGYFKAVFSDEAAEIYVVSITNAALLNQGVLRSSGLVEVEFTNTDITYDIAIEYLYRQKGTTGGIRYVSTYTIVNNNHISYDFRVLLLDEYAFGETGEFRIDKQYVSELGYYYFTMDVGTLSALGRTETPSSRFTVGELYSFTYNGVSSPVLTFNIYDISNALVKTVTHTIDTIGLSNAKVEYFYGDTHGRGIINTVVNTGGTASITYTQGNSYPPGLTELDVNAMVAYDIFNLADPKRLTNRVAQYGYLGSVEYPYDFYRASDITNFLLDEDRTETTLNNLRKISLDVQQVAGELSLYSVRISSNGTVTFADDVPIINETNNITQTGVGRLILEGSIDNGYSGYYSDSYGPLYSVVAGVMGINPSVNHKAYVVGPSNEVLLILPEMSAKPIPSTGKTIIKYKEPSGEWFKLSVSPDEVPDDLNSSGIIRLTGTPVEYVVLSVSYAGKVTVTEDI